MHIVTWGVTVYNLLLRVRASQDRRRLHILLIAFVTVLFVTGTIAFSGSSKLIELMFVDNRNYPSGPSGWWIDVGQFTSWIVLSDAGYYFSEALADGLLVSDVVLEFNCGHLLIYVAAISYLGSLGQELLHYDRSCDSLPLRSG